MGKREENKAQKRTALERSALELFLKQGYAFTSVEQIVAEADIARGTYYLYFTDKEELFRHLVEKLMGPLMQRLERCRDALNAAKSVDEARALCRGLEQDLVKLLLEQPGIALLYLREERAMGPVGEWLRTLGARIDDFTMDMIVSLQTRGVIRAMDARVAARAISGVVERLVFDVLAGTGNLGDFGEVAPEVLKFITEGVNPTGSAVSFEGSRQSGELMERRLTGSRN